MQISTTANPTPVDLARLEEIHANPGFGQHFTDHMLLVEWTPDAGWHDARIQPYGPLTLDPATAYDPRRSSRSLGTSCYRGATQW
jgi:branched-chain amino acid aminotransferase